MIEREIKTVQRIPLVDQLLQNQTQQVGTAATRSQANATFSCTRKLRKLMPEPLVLKRGYLRVQLVNNLVHRVGLCLC